jgi:hypothetical protein
MLPPIGIRESVLSHVPVLHSIIQLNVWSENAWAVVLNKTGAVIQHNGEMAMHLSKAEAVAVAEQSDRAVHALSDRTPGAAPPAEPDRTSFGSDG